MEPWHPQKVHGQWWSQCLTQATVPIQFLISPLRSWNSSWDLLSFVSPEHSLQQTPGNQVLHWQILIQQGLQEPCTRCLRARSSIFLLKCRCHFTVFQGHSYLNVNGKPSQTQIRTICLILLGNDLHDLAWCFLQLHRRYVAALQWWKLDFQKIIIEALDPHASYTPSRPRGPWKRSKNVVLLGGSRGWRRQQLCIKNMHLKTPFWRPTSTEQWWSFKGMFAL